MTVMIDLTGFTFAHPIFVIDNNTIKFKTQAATRDMAEIVCNLINEYKAETIIVSNSKNKYGKNLGQKIKNIYIAKYASEPTFDIQYL